MEKPYCAVCEYNQTEEPTMVLARWRDQWVCTSCLADRPGQAETEAEALGARPAMTQAVYRDYGGGRCPQCDSEDLGMDDMYFQPGIIGQRVHCGACGLAYEELYRLAGYVRLDGTPGADADWEAFLTTWICEGSR